MARGNKRQSESLAPPPPPLPTGIVKKVDISHIANGVHDKQMNAYGFNDLTPYTRPEHYVRYIEPLDTDLARQVEYDMDEQDEEWLAAVNAERKRQQIGVVSYELFEVIMDRLEKDYFDVSKHMPKRDLETPPEDAPCAICDDAEGENSNAIVFCDGCNLAVHQDCYGVQYIPEGQWLCRKCKVSPSHPVACALCPNEGGAFKQTAAGDWVHVLCAYFMPGCGVDNSGFMEPCQITNVEPKRFKLPCSICGQGGASVGACIQCTRASCTTAYHVTCGRKLKLLLPIKGGYDLQSFCPNHLPDDFKEAHHDALAEEAESNSTENSKAARAYAKTYTTAPPVIPWIIADRITSYTARVSFRQRQEFILSVCKYWSLKREHRRGAPLLKRLHMEAWSTDKRDYLDKPDMQKHKLEVLQGLRADLERARTIAELVRKRESRKLRQIHVVQNVVCRAIFAHEPVMRATFERITAIDKTHKYFKNPVSKLDWPEYFDIIEKPMCWNFIQEKLDRHEYWDVKAFKDDIELVCKNAKTFNSKPTDAIHRTAERIEAQLPAIFQELENLRTAHPENGESLDDVDSVGDLEPHIDVLDALYNPESIQDDVDYLVAKDAVTSLFDFSLGQSKPPPVVVEQPRTPTPPPPPTPPPVIVSASAPKRDRSGKAKSSKKKKESLPALDREVTQEDLDRGPGFRAPSTSTSKTSNKRRRSSTRNGDDGSGEEEIPWGGQAAVPMFADKSDKIGPMDTFRNFDAGWVFPDGTKRMRGKGSAPAPTQVQSAAKKRKVPNSKKAAPSRTVSTSMSMERDGSSAAALVEEHRLRNMSESLTPAPSVSRDRSELSMQPLEAMSAKPQSSSIDLTPVEDDIQMNENENELADMRTSSPPAGVDVDVDVSMEDLSAVPLAQNANTSENDDDDDEVPVDVRSPSVPVEVEDLSAVHAENHESRDLDLGDQEHVDLELNVDDAEFSGNNRELNVENRELSVDTRELSVGTRELSVEPPYRDHGLQDADDADVDSLFGGGDGTSSQDTETDQEEEEMGENARRPMTRDDLEHEAQALLEELFLSATQLNVPPAADLDVPPAPEPDDSPASELSAPDLVDEPASAFVDVGEDVAVDHGLQDDVVMLPAEDTAAYTVDAWEEEVHPALDIDILSETTAAQVDQDEVQAGVDVTTPFEVTAAPTVEFDGNASEEEAQPALDVAILPETTAVQVDEDEAEPGLDVATPSEVTVAPTVVEVDGDASEEEAQADLDVVATTAPTVQVDEDESAQPGLDLNAMPLEATVAPTVEVNGHESEDEVQAGPNVVILSEAITTPAAEADGDASEDEVQACLEELVVSAGELSNAGPEPPSMMDDTVEPADVAPVVQSPAASVAQGDAFQDEPTPMLVDESFNDTGGFENVDEEMPEAPAEPEPVLGRSFGASRASSLVPPPSSEKFSPPAHGELPPSPSTPESSKLEIDNLPPMSERATSQPPADAAADAKEVAISAESNSAPEAPDASMAVEASDSAVSAEVSKDGPSDTVVTVNVTSGAVAAVETHAEGNALVVEVTAPNGPNAPVAEPEVEDTAVTESEPPADSLPPTDAAPTADAPAAEAVEDAAEEPEAVTAVEAAPSIALSDDSTTAPATIDAAPAPDGSALTNGDSADQVPSVDVVAPTEASTDDAASTKVAPAETNAMDVDAPSDAPASTCKEADAPEAAAAEDSADASGEEDDGQEELTLAQVRELNPGKDVQQDKDGRFTITEYVSAMDKKNLRKAMSKKEPKVVLGAFPEGQRLESGTLVWAQVSTHPFYPAIIHDSDILDIPSAILKGFAKFKDSATHHIVKFLDAKGTWSIVTLKNLRQLGDIPELDNEMLAQKYTSKNKKQSLPEAKRKEIKESYDRALKEMDSDQEGDAPAAEAVEGEGDKSEATTSKAPVKKQYKRKAAAKKGRAPAKDAEVEEAEAEEPAEEAEEVAPKPAKKKGGRKSKAAPVEDAAMDVDEPEPSTSAKQPARNGKRKARASSAAEIESGEEEVEKEAPPAAKRQRTQSKTKK